MKKYVNDNRSAQTLCMTVLVLIAVATLCIFVISKSKSLRSDMCERECAQNIDLINRSIDRYYLEIGSLPKTLDELVHEGYFHVEIPICPVTDKPYRLNRHTGQILAHSKQLH